MKICFQQFLGKNHSWSIVGQNISRALIKQGHEIHLQSTNGYDHFPDDLVPYKRELLDNNYDMQLSYTAMLNFPKYLSHGTKNRFGIWNYESTEVPKAFIKYHKYCDKMLPSSNFARDIFVRNKIPINHMVVVPHGINVKEYSTTEKYNLKTNKKTKILANIAQPHVRKNLPGLFEAYGRAFNKSDDDVCLVAKVSVAKKLEHQFDVDFYKILNAFKAKFPQHAEIEIITDFLPTMAPLYNATQIVFSMTFSECFWLPGLEALATDNLVIAPRYGGQLDFLDDQNSILVDGKIVRAPREMQYWTPSPYAEMFEPDIEHAASALQNAVYNYNTLMEEFRPGMKTQVDRLTWDNVAKQIVDMCE